MRHTQTNAELVAFHAEGTGVVFNDFTSGRSAARYNVLHLAGCPWVGRMLDRAEPEARPSVRKLLFATDGEAQAWLTSNRGQEGHGWKYCATCWVGRAETGGRSHPKATVQPTSTREAPNAADRATGTPAVADSWPADLLPFAMPTGHPFRLPVPPRLASWNKVGDPEQVRLAGYLDTAEKLLRPRLERLSGQLALRLDVGLPGSAALLNQRDLDNYLFPLATRLSRAATHTVDCVWGTKQHSDSSLVRIEQAMPAVPPPFELCRSVRTTASSTSTAFKKQISEQLGAISPIPPGPVQMQLCFTVGPGRNWLTLWKPTIDALGPILGYTPAAGPWSPLDGRIVDLGLHRSVNPSIRNDVLITVAATSIRE
jgi:hypothetical protein